MKKSLNKFKSRKLWFVAALFISGLFAAFGGDADTAQTIAGYVMQIGAALSYIIVKVGRTPSAPQRCKVYLQLFPAKM